MHRTARIVAVIVTLCVNIIGICTVHQACVSSGITLCCWVINLFTVLHVLHRTFSFRFAAACISAHLPAAALSTSSVDFLLRNILNGSARGYSMPKASSRLHLVSLRLLRPLPVPLRLFQELPATLRLRLFYPLPFSRRPLPVPLRLCRFSLYALLQELPATLRLRLLYPLPFSRRLCKVPPAELGDAPLFFALVANARAQEEILQNDVIVWPRAFTGRDDRIGAHLDRARWTLTGRGCVLVTNLDRRADHPWTTFARYKDIVPHATAIVPVGLLEHRGCI